MKIELYIDRGCWIKEIDGHVYDTGWSALVTSRDIVRLVREDHPDAEEIRSLVEV